MPTTTVHLIRHGQSEFNAAFDSIKRIDPMIFDPRLTELGRAQAAALADPARWARVELVVASPFTRAIETAQLAFAGHGAPMRIEALHRERAEHSGDIGRAPAALKADFPHLEFDHLDDPWWHHDPARPDAITIESEEILSARVAHFADWLRARPEREMAVVGHGTFLRFLTGRPFANCEVVTLDF
ncbi:MAG: histidine phosphatase family protein [Alphaproteobacteria bacterium]|nr:histidine phosphatase family protein [Alphaproteobacteria bacterium]